MLRLVVAQHLLQRAARIARRDGVAGLFALGTKRVVGLLNWLRPSIRREIREREERAILFDEKYGVDTGQSIHPVEFNMIHPNKLHAISYRGSDPLYFTNAIKSLQIDYHRFVFVDFGSGKGRALLMAMQFPFKRIVGVEFCKELHFIAQNNIRQFQSDEALCKDVESLCTDAVDYNLPEDRLVCYFCNPFDAVIMARMLSNIRDSFLKTPREIFVVYYNPRAGHLFDRDSCFTKKETVGPVSIWRMVPVYAA